MRPVYLFSIFLLLLARDSLCQQLTAIPDRTFWNTSYTYQLHYRSAKGIGEARFYLGNSKEEEDRAAFSKINEIVSNCYLGKEKFGILPCSDLDTDINVLLSNAINLFNKQSIINLDYYDGKDTFYKAMLAYLYNASIEKDTDRKSSFLSKAKGALDRIAPKSIYKSIGFVQSAMVEQSITERGYPKSLDEIDSIAYGLIKGNLFSQQNLADWYEVMGDFWVQYDLVSKYTDYYIKAQDYVNLANDSASIIQSQRILEKLTLALQPSASGDNSFRPVGLKSLNSLLIGPSEKTKEFFCHNKILSYSYNDGSDNKSSEAFRELTDLCSGSENNFLADEFLFYNDYLNYLDILISKSRDNNDPELLKKSELLWLNIATKYNLTRGNRIDATISSLAHTFISLKDYRSAKIVNKYIGQLSKNRNDNRYFDSILNSAEFYCYENRTDTAIKIAKSILSADSVLSDFVKLRTYQFLRYIAFIQNDMASYAFYRGKMDMLKPNRSQEYGDVVQLLVNRDRDYQLNDSISYYNQLTFAISAKNIAISRSLKASDSLRLSQNINDSLIQKGITDSLLIKKQEVENAKLKQREAETRGRNILLLAVLLVIIIIIVFLFVRRKLESDKKLAEADRKQSEVESKARESKAEAEKERLEADKFKFELESLRAPYLGHAIGDSFKYIINRIETAIETGDQMQLTKAKKITKATSGIFNDIILYSSEKTNLWSEVSRNEKYVNFIGDCLNRTIIFKKVIPESLGENIMVPSYFLLDIYINAIQHGQLRLKTDGLITTTLSMRETDNEYLLTVEDNGIGLSEARRNKDQEHISTGLSRVLKQLEFFNEDKSGTEILFDPATDTIEMYDDAGKVTGTKVTFRIKVYGNS